MRYASAKAVRAFAAVLTAGSIIGSEVSQSQTMSQPKRVEPSVKVARSPAGPMSVMITSNGGGITLFGGVSLDFGDGQHATVCPPGSGCRETVVTHAYAKPGTFTVKLVGRGEPDQKPLAEATVTVPVK